MTNWTKETKKLTSWKKKNSRTVSDIPIYTELIETIPTEDGTPLYVETYTDYGQTYWQK